MAGNSIKACILATLMASSRQKYGEITTEWDMTKKIYSYKGESLESQAHMMITPLFVSCQTD